MVYALIHAGLIINFLLPIENVLNPEFLRISSSVSLEDTTTKLNSKLDYIYYTIEGHIQDSKID